jgi:tetratricopeptide (TPR) repeat protein
MDNFNRFGLHAALIGGALLLCFSLTAGADEIQDINKLFKQNQHAQALKRVDIYLTNKPKDAQARFLKGLILTTQRKTNDAISIFSSLTEDYPELPEPYNNLAVLYAGLGQYDKAKVALETQTMPPHKKIWAISTPKWQARLMSARYNWIVTIPLHKPSSLTLMICSRRINPVPP